MHSEGSVELVPSFSVPTKAITVDTPGIPKRSLKWVRARRVMGHVIGDQLLIGDRAIAFDTVVKATMYLGRQLFFVRAFVLELQTNVATHQLGMRSDGVVEHLPFEVTSRRVRFRWSLFSVAARLLVVAGLILLFWPDGS